MKGGMMNLELTPLTAISPVDGRYRRATKPLAEYFSEQALIRYRTMVEIEYFIALCEIPLPQLADFPKDQFGPRVRLQRTSRVKTRNGSRPSRRKSTTMSKPWNIM
jgi:hypothetical protein